jgi:hypothetical protein
MHAIGTGVVKGIEELYDTVLSRVQDSETLKHLRLLAGC